MKEALNELDPQDEQQSLQPDPNAENSLHIQKKQSQEAIRKKTTVDNGEQSQEERSESDKEALNEPLLQSDATQALAEQAVDDDSSNEHIEEALNQPLLQSDATQAFDEHAVDDDSSNEPLGLELNQDPRGNEAQFESNQRLHVARGKTPAVKPTTRGKTPRNKTAREDNLRVQSSKRMRTRKSQDVAYDEEFFDSAYHARTLKHKMPARMKYDPVLDAYFACYVEGFRFSSVEEVTNKLDKFDDILVNQAKENPNEWQGCSIGDSFDGIVPSKLATSVKIPFRQYNERFCLTLSLANALDYCNFTEEAKVLASQAPFLPR